MPEEVLKTSFTGDASGIEQASQDAAAALVKMEGAAKSSGTQLAKTLGQLQDQLKRFQDGLKNTNNTESFARIQRAVDATKQRIDLLNNINAFQGVKKGSAEATQSLINLSRVAQDAPYGFIGIANNLNPLLESFQRLQRESGGTKAALSALGGELMGAGGIGLAVGVVSSLLVVFGQNLFGAKNKTDDLSKAFDNLAESSGNVVQSVENLQSILNSISTGQGLIFKLKGKGQADFLKEELKSIEMFRDMATAAAKGQQERDIYNETNYFNQSQDIRDKIDQQLKQHNDNVRKLQADATQWEEKVRLQRFKIQLQEKEDAEDAAKKSEEARKKAQEKAEQDQKDALEKMKEWLAKRREIIAEFSKDFASIKIFTLPDVGDPKDNDVLFERLRKNLMEQANKMLPVHFKIPADFDLTTKGMDATKTIPLKMNFQIEMDQKAFADAAKKIQEKIDAFNSQITSAFTALGQGIGTAAATGNLKSLFAPVFNVIASYLEKLGEASIATGVAMLGLKNALEISFANPIAQIGAGVALVAASAIVRAKLSGIKPFAEGGLVFGPTIGMVGEGIGTSRSNPEVISPLNKLKEYITPKQGTIAMPQGQWVLRGKDFVFMMNQVQKSQRRAT